MAEIGNDILKAASILAAGELVAIPTETVYGLAGNALSEEAVVKIFATKNRPSFDPLIVHIKGIEEVGKYAAEFPEQLKQLALAYWPGPLTLLLPKKSVIPDLVTSGLGRVALRVPNHPLTAALLGELPFPLAAPSANPFGYVSPTTAGHVADQLGSKLPYILDGGSAQVGLESTIIGIENGLVVVYRKGGIPIEQIEELVGTVKVMAHSSSQPAAPGMLKSHYSPGKKITILAPNIYLPENSTRVGYIGFHERQPGVPSKHQILLSATADYAEAARNLFAALRTTEQWEVDEVFVSLLPEQGLGVAINDRLRRAAAR